MGNATKLAEALVKQPLSKEEIDERRKAARVREDISTTLDGNIVQRVIPTAAPMPIRRPEPSTWD